RSLQRDRIARAAGAKKTSAPDSKLGMSMLQLSRARRARASVPSTRSLAVLALAAAALLAACAAPGPSEDSEGSIEGTLQIAIIEDHAAGTMIRQPLLQRADGSMLLLVFDPPPPVGAGTRVKLTGFFEAKALLHVQHLEVVRSTELGTDDITVARSAVSTMTPVK